LPISSKTYIFVGCEIDVLYGLCLEPSASVSKFIRNYSHTIKVRIVEIDLIVRVSPSITDSHTLESNPSISQKSIIIHKFASKGRNIMPRKRLPSDIKRTLLQGRPLLVKIVKEVNQMVRRLVS
jgi:hypothetical protein